MRGFLILLGGLEREHSPKMSQNAMIRKVSIFLGYIQQQSLCNSSSKIFHKIYRKAPEAYSKLCQTSKMVRFAKIANDG